MTIVILAEKGEQGEKIATALGFSVRGKRSFHGRINGRNACVCWAAGHLLTPQDPDKEKPDMNWFSPVSLLPAPMQGKMVLTERGRNYISGIKENVSKATEVWIATDPDREGEAIGRNILEHLNYKGPVKRMWLSESLEPNDIQKAVGNLIEGHKHLPLWRAQQARQNADWMWQLLVRAYTMKGRAGLMGSLLGQGKGRSSVVSVGRVQSATLKMIVDRDHEIANFQPIDHFQVYINTNGFQWPYQPPAGIEPIKGSHIVDDKGKLYFINKAEADEFVARLAGSSLSITKATPRKQLRQPPTPYSLTKLQQVMARKYGMSSSKTLKLADKVRMDGYLTYPRTEHGLLPLSLYNPDDLKAQLAAVSAVEELAEHADNMASLHPQQEPPKCYTSKPMEHHGIIPTGKVPDLNAMSKDEAAIFTECARAFVTALHPPAEYDVLEAEGLVNTHGMVDENPALFKRSFKTLTRPGWLVLQGAGNDKKDEEMVSNLPNFEQNDALNIDSAVAKASRTSPPKHFNEASLLNAMLNAGRLAEGADARILREAKGIGTPATRAAIIETLVAREYIQKTRSRVPLIKATEKGSALIKHIPSELADVAITASWEAQLKDIEAAITDQDARGLRDKFMQEQHRMISNLIQDIVDNMAHIETKAPSYSDEPSEKQLALVRKLGQELGVDTATAERSRKAASAFIDKHIKKARKARSKANPPTEKMLKFAKDLAERNKVKLPKNAETTFDDCKKFIDQQLKK